VHERDSQLPHMAAQLMSRIRLKVISSCRACCFRHTTQFSAQKLSISRRYGNPTESTQNACWSLFSPHNCSVFAISPHRHSVESWNFYHSYILTCRIQPYYLILTMPKSEVTCIRAHDNWGISQADRRFPDQRDRFRWNFFWRYSYPSTSCWRTQKFGISKFSPSSLNSKVVLFSLAGNTRGNSGCSWEDLSAKAVWPEILSDDRRPYGQSSPRILVWSVNVPLFFY
jgi:hypothetical protein